MTESLRRDAIRPPAVGPGEFELHCDVEYLRAVHMLAQREGLEELPRLQARLVAAQAALAAHPSAGAMSTLKDRLGLAEVHTNFLWAAVAFSADPRLTAHAEALGGPLARRGLSPALYTELRALNPGVGRHLAIWLSGANPLVEHGLLAPADDRTTPAARPYVAQSRFLAHLVGDDAIEAPLRRMDVAGVELIHDAVQARALAELSRTLDASSRAVVILEGPRASGRNAAAGRGLGRPLVILDAALGSPDGFEDALLALRREMCLSSSVPVIANAESSVVEGVPSAALSAFIDGASGNVVLTSSVPGLDLGIRRPVIRIRWTIPDMATRRALWESFALIDGVPPTGDLDTLALRYRVGPGAISRAVASTAMMRIEPGATTSDALAAGLRHNIAERVGALASRVEVTQTWDDLVLADDTRDQVEALLARVRYAHKVLEQWKYKGKMARGTGVPALFSGSPGTGKTMTAGLIARELDLELYQVDLSQVVSKWVGETEKQLSRVFEAAEEGHALLLFDECDALFGQRSAEVKGAVDRYANLEVNYLLQRIEAFGGITILTTNLDANIDRALKRRLAAHIVFDPPDEDERALLWQRMSATGAAPLAERLDFEELARLFPTMTGANIRNAVLSGAFFAAAGNGNKITQEHLLRAARVEYRSMGHMLADRGRQRRSEVS